MAYYKDLTVCRYFPAESWLCRLISVGWIEFGKPYSKGRVSAEILNKLEVLRREFLMVFPEHKFRGLHQCTICEYECGCSEVLDCSHVNLFLPFEGFVFVAPGRIDHYIEKHNYLPPESFLESVLKCPSPSSVEFRELIKVANRGYDAPLYV